MIAPAAVWLRCIGLVLLAASCAGAQRAGPPLPPGELDRLQGSAAAARLGTEGWIIVREIRWADPAKYPAAIAVEGRLAQGPEPEELRLSIWRPTPEGWTRIGESEPLPGSSVELLEVASCSGEDRLLFAAVEEEPDQRRHRLVVYEELPALRRMLGLQRDVESSIVSRFEPTADGFAFVAGGAVERWSCVDGAYEPSEPTE